MKSIHELNETKAWKEKSITSYNENNERPFDEEKKLGQKVNECRDQINKLIDDKRVALEEAKILEKLNSEKIDVTLPEESSSWFIPTPLLWKLNPSLREWVIRLLRGLS